jgi:stearoyl-CoA desaturase (delta-9 desaturase)
MPGLARSILKLLREAKASRARERPSAQKQAPLSLSLCLSAYAKMGFGWGAYLTFLNHAGALWCLPLLWNRPDAGRLLLEAFLLYRVVGSFGVTMGAHRYWSHHSFKASAFVQVLMMLFQTMSFQGSIYEWARDHRSHHTHVNTDADPYNAKRGLLFSHIGWIFEAKHEEVSKKLVGIKDLRQDRLVQFQRRWYLVLAPLMCYGVPALYGHYVYNDAMIGFLVLGCVRWVICSHSTWLVNSLAHSGSEGDGTVDSYVVAFFTAGEGFHNWHHTYPSDAYGSPRTLAAFFLNNTGVTLRILEGLGLVSHLKTAPATATGLRWKSSGLSVRLATSLAIAVTSSYLIQASLVHKEQDIL